ncbi:hypothetical protein [Sphaerisporangium sp. TRM90804]|uniref:hypothetical protein n=1 Tax=Sphaerisporangium sp. TRM90804 TaxID=3031113 RepID=UPI00244B9457|nr:hypothetical protein [Sphaerisporangium sp. TRM90804]MDH2424386.1 hypothetical protein [Sphaerisporangium sp. TRM90804]
MKTRSPSPGLVLDPWLPADIARVLRDSPEALQAVRAGRTPPASGPAPATLLGMTALLLFMLLLTGPWGMVTVGAVATGFRGVQLLAGDPREREARRRLRIASAHAGRFLLPDDFDAGCGALMARAQDAAATVLGSRVNHAGLLDAIDNAVTLPAELWRLGQRLAGLTRTRAEHDRIVPRDLPDDVAQAFTPYEEALGQVLRSLETRVAALEDYAGEVARADAVYLAYQRLGVLRERTPDYERLLAETAEDDPALSPVLRLTDQAREMELTFRATLTTARRAADHLRALTAA